MFEYIIALICLGILAYLVKARVKAKALILAFITFIVASFLWGTVADYFGLKPGDLLTSILYSLVGFTLFWIIWVKWLRGKAD